MNADVSRNCSCLMAHSNSECIVILGNDLLQRFIAFQMSKSCITCYICEYIIKQMPVSQTRNVLKQQCQERTIYLCNIRPHVWAEAQHFPQDDIQGPVVQSVVSLTSSLRVISLTVLADSICNILIFFAEKM